MIHTETSHSYSVIAVVHVLAAVNKRTNAAFHRTINSLDLLHLCSKYMYEPGLGCSVNWHIMGSLPIFTTLS